MDYRKKSTKVPVYVHLHSPDAADTEPEIILYN